MNSSQRNFSTWGKWVTQRTKAEILVCVCGKKYIRTRKGQTDCLPCTYDKNVKKR